MHYQAEPSRIEKLISKPTNTAQFYFYVLPCGRVIQEYRNLFEISPLYFKGAEFRAFTNCLLIFRLRLEEALFKFQ